MLNKFISRPHLDALLFHFLKRIYRWERSIKADYGLNYQEIYLLQHLREYSPCRVSDIAEELRIPRFKATRLVSRLAQQEMLDKQKDAADQRVVMVSLLPNGDQVLSRIEENSFHLISENAARLSDEEIKAFLLAAANIDKILNLPEAE